MSRNLPNTEDEPGRRRLTIVAISLGCTAVAWHALWRGFVPVGQLMGEEALPSWLQAILGGTFYGLLMPAVWPLQLIVLPPHLYLAFAGIAALVGVAAIIHERPSGRAKSVVAVGIVAIASLPWTIAYEIPVQSAPGHVLHVPTTPGRIQGVAKAFHQRFDGTPCVYTLLEWADDGTLYYQSDCVRWPRHTVWGRDGDGTKVSRSARRQVWAFQPDSGGAALAVPASPSELEVEARRGDNLQWDVSVQGLSSAPEHLSIVKGPPMPSPDGRWVAVPVARIYEPQDVVVVSRHR